MDPHVKVVHNLVGIRRVVGLVEPIGVSKFDPIRELEPTEFAALMKAIARIRQFVSAQSLRLMVEQNYTALRQILEEAAQEFAATQKAPEYLVVNAGAEINRHLMNFLASFRSFIDHSETQLHNADTSGTWKKRFKERASALYDAVFSYRFLYELRNYVQHYGLPLGGIHASAWRDQQGNVQTEFRAYLARDALLRWSNWKSIVRTDLEVQSEKMQILPLAEELMECIQRLNEVNLAWEKEHGLLEAVQRLGPAMEEIVTVRMDVTPALVTAPKKLIDSMDMQVIKFPMAGLLEALDLIAGDSDLAPKS